MRIRNFKKIGIFFTSAFLIFTPFVHAVDCSKYSERANVANKPSDILYLVCPLQTGINVGLYFVGSVLIIMILYGGIKVLTSTGDPKQLEGAKMTWTHAIFGALIVLLAIFIVSVLFGLFGSTINPLSLTNGQMETDFQKLWKDLQK